MWEKSMSHQGMAIAIKNKSSIRVLRQPELKGKIMQKIIAILSVLMVTLGASACNTMKGVGKDVERGGEKMQGAAQNAQDKDTSQGSSK
ncbi:MAG TPA: entericidin A/B family lipoprotein [Burkholderiaceae bacterium]|nr:entericidin A/B family lipoprotein [Burkholderiaceae bacterium]